MAKREEEIQDDPLEDQDVKEQGTPEGEGPAGDAVSKEAEDDASGGEAGDGCEPEDIQALKKEIGDLKDQYLRKHAEFENYRKRMAREKADAIKFGNQELLKDLIEVIDNFDRAIKSSGESRDFESFKKGISMIEQQFTGMLENKWGLKKMLCEGLEYDPNQHEALMMEEAGDIEVPTVLEDFQAGYTLHGRVLRPAKVKVGKPASREAVENETKEGE